MARIFKSWPISPTTEIIAMSFAGIAFTAMQEPFFSVRYKEKQVMDLKLPRDRFSSDTEHVIKSALTYVILMRSMTGYLYLICYLFLLWSALFETTPLLLLPWLVIGIIKKLFMDLIVFVVGVYICYVFGEIRPTCIEFVTVKCTEAVLSVYLWLSVLQLYQDLVRSSKAESIEDLLKNQVVCASGQRRFTNLSGMRSLRSEPDDNIELHRTESSYSQVEQRDSEIDFTGYSRSLDSLYSRLHYDWKMVDSFLKRREEEISLDPSVQFSPAEKAARFLGLTQAEINERKEMKRKTKKRLEVGTQASTLSRKFLKSQEVLQRKASQSSGNGSSYESISKQLVPPSPGIIHKVAGNSAGSKHMKYSSTNRNLTSSAKSMTKSINKASGNKSKATSF